METWHKTCLHVFAIFQYERPKAEVQSTVLSLFGTTEVHPIFDKVKDSENEVHPIFDEVKDRERRILLSCSVSLRKHSFASDFGRRSKLINHYYNL